MRLNAALIGYLEANGSVAVAELQEIGAELAADHVVEEQVAVPLLLDADDHALLLRAAAVLGAALPELPQALFGSLEAAMQEVHAPRSIVPFLRAETPLAVKISRSDFLHGKGGWRIGEINISGGVGGLTVGDYDKVIRRHRLVSQFLDRNRLRNISPLDALVRAVWVKCAGLAIDGRPAVAIVDWQGCGGGQEAEQQQIAEFYRRNGFDAVVCHHREVQYRKGRLWHEKQPIHIIHRAFLLEDLPTDPESAMPVLKAAAEGVIILISPFRDEWLASKAAFALLHGARARGKLGTEAEEIVTRMVPPTWLLGDGAAGRRRFSVTPGELRTRHPGELVLKPVIGSAGAGVLLGISTPPDIFWNAVRQAAREGGTKVIQDFIPPGPISFPWLAGNKLTTAPVQPNVGVFYVDGEYAGTEARMLPGVAPGIIGVRGGAFSGSVWSRT